MWCTRWYLPLLLLPLPVAPPYFLLLFLFSLTIHARPCFYCVVLLTTSFISSCYWQPFPIHNSLSIPWSENITTFSDALKSSLPDSSVSLPSVMRAVDRCWCDFSGGNFFEPYNISQWERTSVNQLRADLLKEKLKEAVEPVPDVLGYDAKSSISPVDIAPQPIQPTTSMVEMPRTADSAFSTAMTAVPLASSRGSVWSALNPFNRNPSSTLSSSVVHTPILETQEKLLPEEPIPPPEVAPETAPVPLPTAENFSLIRREYDLRPYGVDVVIDFGWSR